MVMVKKLSPMESSKPFYLMLLLCFLAYVSCSKTQSKQANSTVFVKEKSTILNDSIYGENKFIPDSTINNVLILNNRESSKKFYPKISSENLINFLRESPVLGFSDKTRKEYLLLYQYEGGVKDEFSCFEIGYISDLQKEITKTGYSSFKTESGLKLGMSFEELIKIKGKDYTKKENNIIYQINDYSNSIFLRKYNMPSYFLECTMKDDKIIKIKLGFDYP